MTPVEATKLCAKVMGLRIVYPDQDDLPLCVEGPGGAGAYNPLKWDADAMALVKKLKLPIRYEYDKWEVANKWAEHVDLNAAIVYAVAQMRAKTGGDL